VSIEFIQHLFPDGQKSPQHIVRPIEIEVMANQLKKQGFQFEIENDRGQIWMTIIKHKSELYVDAWCKDGPDVPVKVDWLVTEAYRKFGQKK
jgi:hypothetical protein